MADDEVTKFAQKLSGRIDDALAEAQAAMASFLADRAHAGYDQALKTSPVPEVMRPTRKPGFGRIMPLARIRPLVSFNPLIKEPVETGGLLALGKDDASAKANAALTNQDILSRGDLDAAVQIFRETFKGAIGKIGA